MADESLDDIIHRLRMQNPVLSEESKAVVDSVPKAQEAPSAVQGLINLRNEAVKDIQDSQTTTNIASDIAEIPSALVAGAGRAWGTGKVGELSGAFAGDFDKLTPEARQAKYRVDSAISQGLAPNPVDVAIVEEAGKFEPKGAIPSTPEQYAQNAQTLLDSESGTWGTAAPKNLWELEENYVKARGTIQKQWGVDKLKNSGSDTNIRKLGDTIAQVAAEHAPAMDKASQDYMNGDISLIGNMVEQVSGIASQVAESVGEGIKNPLGTLGMFAESAAEMPASMLNPVNTFLGRQDTKEATAIGNLTKTRAEEAKKAAGDDTPITEDDTAKARANLTQSELDNASNMAAVSAGIAQTSDIILGGLLKGGSSLTSKALSPSTAAGRTLRDVATKVGAKEGVNKVLKATPTSVKSAASTAGKLTGVVGSSVGEEFVAESAEEYTDKLAEGKKATTEELLTAGSLGAVGGMGGVAAGVTAAVPVGIAKEALTKRAAYKDVASKVQEFEKITDPTVRKKTFDSWASNYLDPSKAADLDKINSYAEDLSSKVSDVDSRIQEIRKQPAPAKGTPEATARTTALNKLTVEKRSYVDELDNVKSVQERAIKKEDKIYNKEIQEDFDNNFDDLTKVTSPRRRAQAITGWVDHVLEEKQDTDGNPIPTVVTEATKTQANEYLEHLDTVESEARAARAAAKKAALTVDGQKLNEVSAEGRERTAYFEGSKEAKEYAETISNALKAKAKIHGLLMTAQDSNIQAKATATIKKVPTGSNKVSSTVQNRTFNSHDPSSLPDEDLEVMKSWKGLTTQNKARLDTEIANRAFRNTMQEVDAMVQDGGFSESVQRDMKGLSEYSSQIKQGIENNKSGVVSQAVEGLQSWYDTQFEKQQAYEAGWELFNTPNRTPEQEQELRDTQKYLRTKYGSTHTKDPIHAKSGRLIEAIQRTTQELGNNLATAQDALASMTNQKPVAKSLRAAKNEVLDTLRKPNLGLTDFAGWREKVNKATSEKEVQDIAKQIEEAKRNPPKPAPKQEPATNNPTVVPVEENASESVTEAPTATPEVDPVAEARSRLPALKKKVGMGSELNKELTRLNLNTDAGLARFQEIEAAVNKPATTEEVVEPTSEVTTEPTSETVTEEVIQDEVPTYEGENDFQEAHDYVEYLSWNELGEIDLIEDNSPKTQEEILNYFDEATESLWENADEALTTKLKSIRKSLSNAPSKDKLRTAIAAANKAAITDTADSGKGILKGLRKVVNLRGLQFERVGRTFQLKANAARKYIPDMGTRLLNFLDTFDTTKESDKEDAEALLARIQDITGLDLDQKSLYIFADFHSKFRDALKKSVVLTKQGKYDPDSGYAYKNWLLDFTDDQGNLNEDMILAMSAGTFSFINQNANETLFNSMDSIDAFTKKSRVYQNTRGKLVSVPIKPDQGRMPAEVYEALVGMGMHRTAFHRKLGSAIYGATGLSLKSSANHDTDFQMKASLGLAAYSTLMEMGILQETTFKSGELLRLAGVDLDTDGQAMLEDGMIIPAAGTVVLAQFNASEVDDRLTLDDEVTDLIGDADVKYIESIFKMESSKAVPSATPTVFKNSLSVAGRRISKAFVNIFNKLNATAREHDTEMVELLSMGVDSLILRAAGWESSEGKIKALVRGIEDKNRGLEKELQDYKDFLDTGLDTFFLTVSPWSNGRYGWKEIVNPQSHKIHRSFVKQKAWKREAKLDTPIMERTHKDLLLAIGAGLGYTPENTSKDGKAVYDTYKAITEDTSVFRPAINILMNAIQSKQGISDADQEVILAAVAEAGEGMHSLESLYAAARYNLAKQSGQKTLTHSLIREVDGKTNGTAWMYSIFAPVLNTKTKEQFNKMGIYFDDMYTHYGDWKENNPSIHDVYQSITHAWESIYKGSEPIQYADDDWAGQMMWEDRLKPANKFDPKRYAALRHLTGDFTIDAGADAEGNTVYTVTSRGRNAGKPFVMTKQYGSGDQASWANFVENMIINRFYENVQEAIDNGDTNALVKEFRAINRFLPENSKLPVTRINTTKVLKNLVFTRGEIKHIARELGNTKSHETSNGFMESVFAAMDIEFEEVWINRDNFNEFLEEITTGVATLRNSLIEAKYRDKFSKLSEDTKAKLAIGKNATDANREDLQYRNYKDTFPLTVAEVAAIDKKIADAGIGFRIPGTDLEAEGGATLLPITTTVLEEKAASGDIAVWSKARGALSAETATQDKRVTTGVGSTFTPLIIQMLDSVAAIASSNDVLAADNNHDAKTAGIELEDAGHSLNAAAFQALKEFNVYEELIRVAGALDKLSAETGVDTKTTPASTLSDYFAFHIKSRNAFMDSVEIFNNYTMGSNTKYTVATDKIADTEVAAALNEGIQSGEIDPFANSSLEKATEVNSPVKPANVPNTEQELDDTPPWDIDQVVDDNPPWDVEDKGPDTTFLSSGRSTNVGTITGTQTLDSSNVLGIFDSLENEGVIKESSAHKARLRTFVSDIVTKVVSTIRVEMREYIGDTSFGSITGEDMVIVNAIQGHTINQSGAVGRLRMSSQETLAHELAHAVLAHGTDTDPQARKELMRIWRLVVGALNDPANAQFVTDNAELVGRVRDAKVVNGKSDFLHEFGAYYVTNEKFHNFVNSLDLKVQSTPWFEGATWMDQLTHFFSKLLDLVNGSLLATNKTKSSKAHMDALVARLANVEVAHGGHLVASLDKGYNYLSNKVDMVNPKIRQAVAAAFKYSNKIPVVGKYVAGMVIPLHLLLNYTTPAKERVIKLARALTEYLYTSKVDAAREAAALIHESKGIHKANELLVAVRRQSKAAIDHNVSLTTATMKETIMEAFDPSIKWTDESKAAMTYLLLKTNAAELLNSGKTVEQIVELLTDTQTRQARVANLIQQLKAADPSNFMTLQAQNLGMFMVSGNSKLHLMRFNAEHIATGYNGTASGMESQVAELASLSAMQYLSDTRSAETGFKEAYTIIKDEIARGIEEDGVTTLLGLTQDSINKAKENLFNNTPFLRMDGFTSDVIDKRMSMEISTDPADQDLLDRGYVMYGTTDKDAYLGSAHSVGYIYINPNGGMADLQSGAISLRSPARKGSKLEGASFALVMAALRGKRRDDAAVYRAGTLRASNLGKNGQGAVALPSYDADGNVQTFRYMMRDSLKDSALRRDMAFETVASYTTATSNARPVAAMYNNIAVEALKDIADNYYAANPEDFVVLSASSKNPAHRDMWNKLPHETKEAVKKHFGSYALKIRKDSVNIAMGQVKWDVMELWDVEPDTLNFVEKSIKFIGDHMISHLPGVTHAPSTLRTVMDFIKHIAKFIKDVIVIRSLKVTFYNTLSNAVTLWTEAGITPVHYMADYVQSWYYLRKYKTAAREAAVLQQKLTNPRLSAGQRTLYEREYAVQVEEMNTSPIHLLMKEGLAHGIEEVSETDEQGLKALLPKEGRAVKLLDGLEDRTPEILKKGVSNFFIMQGSKTHQWAKEFAQVSDFSARYSLISRGLKKGLPEKELVTKAADLFMDYDLPTGRGTQALNDVNLLMFTKYLVRVQKHIIGSGIRNPARFMLMLTGVDAMNIDWSIHSSLLTPEELVNRMSLFGLGATDIPNVLSVVK